MKTPEERAQSTRATHCPHARGDYTMRSDCERCLAELFADAYAQGFAEAREQAAKVAEDWTAQYPESVWPKDGKSPDCIAADMGRHSGRIIGQRIAALQPKGG